MIVNIEPQIYSNEAHYEILDQIVYIFLSEKHSWDISDPEEVLDSEWMNINSAGTRARKRVDDLMKNSVKSIYLSKSERESKLNLTIAEEENQDLLQYQPNHALAVLNDSLYIIVENSNSDKAFIEVLAKSLQRKNLVEAIEKEWILFDTEGGQGGIKRRVQYHQKKPFRARLFVLVDSDRNNAVDHGKTDELISLFRELKVEGHVLFKRAIENYIPLEAFNSLPSELQHIINAYSQLNEEQKDYYNLKKGFNNKGQYLENQIELFGNIDTKSTIFKNLRKGFKNSGYNPNNLYKLFFEKEVVTETSLMKRCIRNKDEIELLLNKISRLL